MAPKYPEAPLRIYLIPSSPGVSFDGWPRERNLASHLNVASPCCECDLPLGRSEVMLRLTDTTSNLAFGRAFNSAGSPATPDSQARPNDSVSTSFAASAQGKDP